MLEFEFLGAAQTVTGSRHLLRTSRATVLLDCGMFQGHRREAFARNRDFSLDPDELDAVVLSHAHIDHSGALPVLYKNGYRGPVFCTPATLDLASPMLQDAAYIQESDARYIQKRIEKDRSDMEPVEPLFTQADVAGILGQMTAVPYRRRHTVAPGVEVTFLDAGHVLGSAVVVLDVDDEGQQRRVAFTGDLGRHHLPILRDPEVPHGVECLLMESTYGDRLHAPIEAMTDELQKVLERTYKRGGKVVIPSFSLERAQEVIFELKRLKEQGRLPPMPVYVDSPLTVKLTEIFKLHPECYDQEISKLLASGDSPFDFDGLTYVSEKADSVAIGTGGPCVIISASGMCEGGRVLHHLRSIIGSEKNTVLIVGFQAQHTLGRRLVEKKPEVRIFGVMLKRYAEVVVLNGFSAHADQAGLLAYAEEAHRRGKLRQLVLVHGEPSAQSVLAELLRKKGFANVAMPALGDKLRV